MKSFAMWKMPILLGSLGAVLLLSPAAKAQSEIAPEHFDGTDSWETTYRAQAVKTSKTSLKERAKVAQSKHVRTAAAGRSSEPAGPAAKPALNAVVVAENRKPAILNEKQ